ncbi:MAG: hypothetical protein K0R98_297 [Rickettsiaceae bacterium]|jgi:hypothetical protein|nr:hypothetical protein [Rickettsiaceae bacterium]
MKNIVILLITILLASCAGKIFDEKSRFAPKPWRMGGPDRENASPEYTEGWDDGCSTGLSTMNPGYYKSFYSFKQDPYKVDNEVYYKAWKDAYTYCRQYSFRFVWDAYDRTNNKSLDNNLCVLCPNEATR